MTDLEMDFAATVFGNTLPIYRIILTNLSSYGGRAFTIPGTDGKIYCNMGNSYNDPLNYSDQWRQNYLG
ncbi:hypothetical protein FB550_111120 [Neobacillus bataviensis]|uniref:Uncharacterized protein n=1 Tax=Neobacillus bataviensis TaxID=220685 RepID=A0A561CYZ9_9BACI|nr:hypothetical protein FB550_111120 [Neobacillus bataviensis]